jgi:hypothetical protein
MAAFDSNAGDAGRLQIADLAQAMQDLMGSFPNLGVLEEINHKLRLKSAISLDEFFVVISEYFKVVTDWGKLNRKVLAPVGFDSLPTQLTKKVLKRGFELNILCVGTLADVFSYCLCVPVSMITSGRDAFFCVGLCE